MIKVFALIRSALTFRMSTFIPDWREPHGRLALQIKPIRRYTQAHRIASQASAMRRVRMKALPKSGSTPCEIALGLGQTGLPA